jgi:excisionase family DNA binding protein
VAVMTEEWLSLTQAANRLGLSSQAVRNMADAGRLGCYRSPLGRLVATEDVERIAAERAAREQRSGGDGAA